MRAGRADLVVLDLMMPGVTGWDVLTERAAEPVLREIPVIVVTAARGDDVDAVAGAGICALLSKPFELEALRALVESCLGQVARAGAGAITGSPA
jgi:CheY-like chemotaxis protein